MQRVKIYSKPMCPFCERAKRLFEKKGAEYEEVNIASSASIRDQMISEAGGRMTVPQIFIGDTHVGGWDDLSALDEAGELDTLLEG